MRRGGAESDCGLRRYCSRSCCQWWPPVAVPIPLGGGSASGDLKKSGRRLGGLPPRIEDHRRDLRAGLGGQRFHRGGAQFGIGSRETYIPAVRDHSIDLVPEYTGNLLQYFDSKTTVTTPDQVELALFRVLPGDLSILTPVTGQRHRHRRGLRGHRAEVESQDHRRFGCPLARGQVRCPPIGVPESHRGGVAGG